MSGTLIRLFLVLLPVVLYLLWLRYSGKRRSALDNADEVALAAAQRELSWGVGFVAVLMVATFAYLAFSGGEDPASRYIPPHMEDGKVVPGHFESIGQSRSPERAR